jgi:hypothetical protein
MLSQLQVSHPFLMRRISERHEPEEISSTTPFAFFESLTSTDDA